MTKEQVIDHWASCLPPEIEDKEGEVSLIREALSPYERWQVIDEDIDSVMSYDGTPLMNDHFFKSKVDRYVEKPIAEIPAIVVLPKGSKQKNVFLMKKYGDDKIRWDIADGYHRVETLRRLGHKKIKVIAPIDER